MKLESVWHTLMKFSWTLLKDWNIIEILKLALYPFNIERNIPVKYTPGKAQCVCVGGGKRGEVFNTAIFRAKIKIITSKKTDCWLHILLRNTKNWSLTDLFVSDFFTFGIFSHIWHTIGCKRIYFCAYVD